MRSHRVRSHNDLHSQHGAPYGEHTKVCTTRLWVVRTLPGASDQVPERAAAPRAITALDGLPVVAVSLAPGADHTPITETLDRFAITWRLEPS